MQKSVKKTFKILYHTFCGFFERFKQKQKIKPKLVIHLLIFGHNNNNKMPEA